MQKADDDDPVRHVRFNSSNIDTSSTEKGLDYNDFPDIYVILFPSLTCFKKERAFTMLGYFCGRQGQLSMTVSIGYL